jgi:hypothetical protein
LGYTKEASKVEVSASIEQKPAVPGALSVSEMATEVLRGSNGWVL